MFEAVLDIYSSISCHFFALYKRLVGASFLLKKQC
nr:MAG TPA: hypothetical protein [Caudoviricetes sp.]